MSETDDPTRTMTLLWRAHAAEPAPVSPGPKPRFEVDEVVMAAIAVADANPSTGVSMRAIAERLGVTPMALYGYVPGKDSLVALAYDAIHAEMPDRTRSADSWREGVLAWADDLLHVYLRHPWALRVSYARPILGPNEQRVLESLISALRATGLGPELLRRVVGLLLHAVKGTAVTITDARQAEEASEMSDRDWWRSSSAALSAVVPDFAERFPDTIWLLSETGSSPAENGPGYVERHSKANLRGGLEVLIDGLEAAVSPSAGSGRQRNSS